MPPRSVPTTFEGANPILRVADMERSVAYYVEMLGFTNAAWGDDTFTLVTRDRAGIYLCHGAQGHPGTWVWVGVGDVILHPPQRHPWAREMKVADPDGHVLRFGSDPD
jgi:catechol 2,3-dioxygenase-like lactoylglutathione lyase family enzyme